jgi:hypothetical protein
VTLPCIVIQRHDASLYEWSVVYDQERVDGEAGDSSITECLVCAVGSLPEGQQLAEIKYRGIHMGTFHVDELAEATEGVAERISAAYGAFAQTL